MEFAQLAQELRTNTIRPCYILKGTERHLVLSAKRQIIDVVFKETKETPDVFSGSKDNMHKVVDCLRTPSMLTPWRLVVVEEADKYKKEDWDVLKIFLDGSLSKLTLIIIGSIRAPYLKGLPKSVAVLDCKKLYPRQTAGWLNMEAKRLGMPISQEAANFLIECVGTELGALSQSLEKLALFVGDKKLIGLGDVEKVVSHTAQQSVFDLTNAIGEQNRGKALQVLNKILEEGEEPIKTLGMISRHFRLLAKAQGLLFQSGGNAGPAFAKDLGVHPFFAKDYVSQARRLKPKGWKKRFDTLYACDKALKSSRNKRGLILERLVWKLCENV